MPGWGRRRTGAPGRSRCAAGLGGPRLRRAAALRCGGRSRRGTQAPGGADSGEGPVNSPGRSSRAAGELRHAGPARAARCGWRSRPSPPGRGRSGASPAARAAAVCPVKRARRSPGPVRIRALAWPLAWMRSPAALRLAAIRARIASTAPSRPPGAPRARPGRAARAALTASSGPDLPWRRRSCRRNGGLHDPDTSRGDAAGQAGAVAAATFDPGQGDGPGPARPAHHPGRIRPRRPGTPGPPAALRWGRPGPRRARPRGCPRRR